MYASGSNHNPRLWRTWLPESGVRPRPPELLAFAGQGARSPTISRQGRLAFTSYRSDSDIQRLELGGVPGNPHALKPPATIIASTRLDHTPQYSPDGSRIAFASDRSGSHEIWVCDRDGANAFPVTSLGGPYTADPAWSPDGRWIAFRSHPQGVEGVFVTRAEGGAPKRLTRSDTDAGICGWSRDGQWIYYSSGPLNDIRLWKIPREGGASVPVSRGRGAGRAIESADGRFLYYLQSEDPVSSLWRMPLPSGEPEKVLDSVYGFNFAVTGTGVFFISHPDWSSVDFLRFADHKIRDRRPP